MGWLKRRKQKKDLVDKLLQEHEKRLVEEEEHKKKKEREEREREEIMQSDEPWVDIKGIVHDPHKGVKIELDWNDAFVKYLRDNGLNAANDEAVVQLWVAMLHQDLLDDFIEDKKIDR